MTLPEGLEPGSRIVVRYRIDGPLPLTDALGVLLSKDAESISVQTKRGVVVIRSSDIVAAKAVPAAARRRAQRA
ncbi:ferrous iron transport protein A [Psychromicrobium sp. YIM B11713]|uniref:putative acetyltransferase n=1 Tax=Psychromicrobium sp. YIM B11713 TaxID=3145233 RepID=UPI00374F7F63